MENKEPWLPAACFYAVSMAYTVGWTTCRCYECASLPPAQQLSDCVALTFIWCCSSELTYYSDLYGPEVLLLMNVCYFAPSVPIMVFQVRSVVFTLDLIQYKCHTKTYLLGHSCRIPRALHTKSSWQEVCHFSRVARLRHSCPLESTMS